MSGIGIGIESCPSLGTGISIGIETLCFSLVSESILIEPGLVYYGTIHSVFTTQSGEDIGWRGDGCVSQAFTNSISMVVCGTIEFGGY